MQRIASTDIACACRAVCMQGFASGDLDADAYSIRLFASARKANGQPMEMLLAQSFAKNMGL